MNDQRTHQNQINLTVSVGVDPEALAEFGYTAQEYADALQRRIADLVSDFASGQPSSVERQ